MALAEVMSDTDPRAIAEDAQAYLPPRPSTVREDQGDVVLRHVPVSPRHWYGSATRPRFDAASAERRIADVRSWFGRLGREEFMWMVGESATPADLRTRLEAMGAMPDPEDPVSEAMVLHHEPPPGPPEIEIGRVRTFEDFRDAMWIPLADAPEEVWAQTEVNLRRAWEEARHDDQMYSFLARIDGRAISTGQLVWLSNGLPYLGGATTLRADRGRGAFRSLVRARWDEAAQRGVPMLLVQAGHQSAPIFRSLGFRTTGIVWIYLDRSTRDSAQR